MLFGVISAHATTEVPSNLVGMICYESYNVPPRGRQVRLLRFDSQDRFSMLIVADALNGQHIGGHPGESGTYSYEVLGSGTARLTLRPGSGEEKIALVFTDARSGTRKIDDPFATFLAGQFRLFPERDAGAVANQSARGYVTSNRPLNCGVVVTKSTFVLLRAVGPTLRTFGISNPAADPVLALTGITSNDDWGERWPNEGFAELARMVGAFPLAPNSKDAVIVAFLLPGAYVATATVKPGDEGEVLLETYVVHADS
jgi:hypothetical protein